MNKNETRRRAEYDKHCRSWRYFERHLYVDFGIQAKLKTDSSFIMMLLLEILKELQFLNRKKY